MNNTSPSLLRTPSQVLCTLLAALMVLMFPPSLALQAEAFAYGGQISFGERFKLGVSMSEATEQYEEFEDYRSFTLDQETTVRLTASSSYLDAGHYDDF